MQHSGQSIHRHRIQLTTPDQAPGTFEVIITEEKKLTKTTCSFQITGNDPETGLIKTSRYTLNERDHNAYLNFFEKLALDFKLRLPQNRRPAILKPLGNASFREVLPQNLHPAIRYGYGDPAVIRVEGGTAGDKNQYYLLATSNDAPDAFPVLRSPDLRVWEFVNFVFSAGPKTTLGCRRGVNQ